MNFKPDLVDAILSGRKTVTRRVVKPGEYMLREIEADPWRGWPQQRQTVFTRDHCIKWQASRDYAVCPGMGKPQVARIKLLHIGRQRLQHIQAQGVPEFRREGFRSRDDFIALWDSVSPKGYRWADNPSVWVLRFELLDLGRRHDL